MPLVYTKEEVKEYLAQRGFDVTDDNLVNKFIHGRERTTNLGSNE